MLVVIDDLAFEAIVAFVLDDLAGRANRTDLALCGACLLYTSDAADERSSVDLGGRRIIKKKQMSHDGGGLCSITVMDTLLVSAHEKSTKKY